MTVPFEKIGPGQSWRLAYQVLGKAGPVFNPTGIRYLGPPGAAAAVALPLDAAAVAAGLGGLSLLAGIGTLALSAATYAEVKRISAEVAAVRYELAELRGVVDEMAQKVERIDVRTSEQALREAMKYVFRRSLTPDGIDLSGLAVLGRDLEQFEQSVPRRPFAWSLQLSSDVRGNLGDLVGMLVGVRRLVASRHNLAVGGDPERVVAMDPEAVYAGASLDQIASRSASVLVSAMAGTSAAIAIAKDFKEREGWLFAEEHLSRLFLSLGVLGPASRLETAGTGGDLVSLLGIAPVRTIFEDAGKPADPELVDIAETGGAAIVLAANRELGKGGLLPAVLEWEGLRQGNGVDVDDVVRRVSDRHLRLLRAWLWRSDAGLVARVRRELEGLNRGYGEVFWPRLSGTAPSVALGEITVSGLLPGLEGGRDGTPIRPASRNQE